ncbi:MAG: sigma-70 family RNA polymerase sigma factor [Planctomycetes bacterium]|nr:sigma-70 family RNA polymerase sigma factor [Planctomycetota bacterium]
MPAPNDASLEIEPESDLLARAARGDDTALGRLIERAAPTVRSNLRGSIPTRWQALVTIDDALQEAYTEAFLSFHRWRPESSGAFVHWLTRLTRNNLIDAVRALETEKRGGRRRRARLDPEASAIELLDHVAGRGSTPSRTIARAEASAALHAAVRRLPDHYREVVIRYDLDGATIESVAEAIGRTPGATYMMRARAHRLLASWLDEV